MPSLSFQCNHREINVVFLDFSIERGTVNTEQACSFSLVSPALAKGVKDMAGGLVGSLPDRRRPVLSLAALLAVASGMGALAQGANVGTVAICGRAHVAVPVPADEFALVVHGDPGGHVGHVVAAP